MEEIRKMLEQQSQLKDRLQELIAEETQLRRQVAAKHDKLAKINMQHSSKMQDLQETLASLQRSVRVVYETETHAHFNCQIVPNMMNKATRLFRPGGAGLAQW